MDPQSSSILALIGLLVLSALFSASETALISSNKVQLKEMADKGVALAENILKLRLKRESTLTTILIINNLVNIGATYLATRIAQDFYPSMIVWVTPIMTAVIVLFGEMLPKTAATRKPFGVSKIVYYPVLISTIISFPIVWLFQKITSGMLWILHVKEDPEEQRVVLEQELEAMLDVSHREGIIPSDERAMIERVFEFGDTTVRDVMIARVDMTVLPIDCNLAQLIQTFRETGYSRIPIFEGSQDNIKGVVHIKDLLSYMATSENNFSVSKIIRETVFIPETKHISELFSEMRLNHIHLAMIVDEYGGVSGLVTLEDILEELVGEIQDEYDKKMDEIIKLNENTYIVPGDTEIEDLNNFLGTNISNEEYGTVAGFMNDKLGHLGKLKERVVEDDITFIVDKIKKFRITKVRVIAGREIPAEVEK
ncbi:MAG: hemolysin family protein [Caldisericia bacterium]